MSESLGLVLLFVLVVGGSFVALQWWQGRQSALDRRREAARSQGLDPDDDDLVLGDMTAAWAAQLPLTEEAEEELRGEIREAGFYRHTALMEYAAVRAMLIILPLLVTFGVALLVPREAMPVTFAVGLVVSGLGYAIPRIYVNQVARTRKRQIERGLPVAVDLLALAMTAGQTLYASLARVAQEVRVAFPELAYELEIVRHHTRLRSLEFALHHWADRVNIPEVRQLVTVLTSSEKLGKDISTGLMEFADHYRTTQRQRADAQASRASVLMLFPMLFGLFLPAAVILCAPIFYEFGVRGRVAADEVRKATDNRKEMMERVTPSGRRRAAAAAASDDPSQPIE